MRIKGSGKISDPYAELEVPFGSPLEVCKKAYKKLARKYHPDLNGDAEKFCRVNEAFGMIEDICSGKMNAKVFESVARPKKGLKHVDLMSFASVW